MCRSIWPDANCPKPTDPQLDCPRARPRRVPDVAGRALFRRGPRRRLGAASRTVGSSMRNGSRSSAARRAAKPVRCRRSVRPPPGDQGAGCVIEKAPRMSPTSNPRRPVFRIQRVQPSDGVPQTVPVPRQGHHPELLAAPGESQAGVVNMRRRPALRAALDGAEAHGDRARIDRSTSCPIPPPARIEATRPGSRLRDAWSAAGSSSAPGRPTRAARRPRNGRGGRAASPPGGPASVRSRPGDPSPHAYPSRRD